LGRTTPSNRMVLVNEVENLKRIIARLPVNERTVLSKLLDDIWDTYNAVIDIYVDDPFKIIVLHLLRKIVAEKSSGTPLHT